MITFTHSVHHHHNNFTSNKTSVWVTCVLEFYPKPPFRIQPSRTLFCTDLTCKDEMYFQSKWTKWMMFMVNVQFWSIFAQGNKIYIILGIRYAFMYHACSLYNIHTYLDHIFLVKEEHKSNNWMMQEGSQSLRFTLFSWCTFWTFEWYIIIHIVRVTIM